MKAIVDAHEGEIALVSERGAGTTPAIRLPLEEATATPLSARPQEEALPRCR